MRSYQALCRRLGCVFQDERLLQSALTHRSAGGANNERLEFLGDSILNFVISEQLYTHFPKANEGELTRCRASLVNGSTLARLAHGLSLGEYMTLGAGELKSGGHRRDSILADALEAVFGAIYLDGGQAQARRVILALYEEALKDISPQAAPKDPKTRLQEYLQGRQLPLPEYVTVSVAGEAHAQMFEVECRVVPLGEVARGAGVSRRRAEQEAAQQLLRRLGHE